MKHIKETNNKKKNSTRKKGKFSGAVFFVWERYTIYGYKEKIISQNKRDYKGTVI